MFMVCVRVDLVSSVCKASYRYSKNKKYNDDMSCIHLRFSWPALTDMVHGSGAEPWVETLGTQGLEILNHPGPQVQHIVPEQFL